jgi:autotransporter-associated beta strand protein
LQYLAQNEKNKHLYLMKLAESTFLAVTFIALASPRISLAQSANYGFLGTSTADNQQNAVTAQPSGGSFSTFTRTGVTWNAGANVFNSASWNTGTAIDLNEFTSYSVTPTAGNIAFLTQVSFGSQKSSSGPANAQVSLFGSTAAGASALASATWAPPTTTAATTFNFTDIIAGEALTFRFYGWNSGGAAGTLRFDDVATTGNTTNFQASSANLTLAAATQVYANASALTLSGAIGGGSNTLTKTGTNVVNLSGASANTYTGVTTVSAGILALNKTAGVNAIAGNVTIGDSAGGLDILRLDANDQIANASVVTFTGSGANAGILRLNGKNETIAGLTSSSAGAGIIENNGTVNSTLTVNNASGTTTFSGLIRDGSTGKLNITKNGLGGLSITGSNNYSGTTTLNAGTLIVGNNFALGTGDVVVDSNATLQIGAGVVLSNLGRTFTVTSGSAVYRKSFANAESFANANQVRSDLSGVDTTAAILGGTANTTGLSVDMSFSAAEAETLSDILSLDGIDGRTFVLSLTVAPGLLDSDSALGWFDSVDGWELAVAGNTGAGSLAGSYEMSYAAFLTANGGFNATTMLGAYGVDTTTGQVWAVVNHNSDFAAINVVPEPGTASLLAAVGVALVGFRRRSRSA